MEALSAWKSRVASEPIVDVSVSDLLATSSVKLETLPRKSSPLCKEVQAPPIFRIRLALESILPPLRLFIATLTEAALRSPAVVLQIFPHVPIWPPGLADKSQFPRRRLICA